MRRERRTPPEQNWPKNRRDGGGIRVGTVRVCRRGARVVSGWTGRRWGQCCARLGGGDAVKAVMSWGVVSSRRSMVVVERVDCAVRRRHRRQMGRGRARERLGDKNADFADPETKGSTFIAHSSLAPLPLPIECCVRDQFVLEGRQKFQAPTRAHTGFCTAGTWGDGQKAGLSGPLQAAVRGQPCRPYAPDTVSLTLFSFGLEHEMCIVTWNWNSNCTCGSATMLPS